MFTRREYAQLDVVGAAVRRADLGAVRSRWSHTVGAPLDLPTYARSGTGGPTVGEDGLEVLLACRRQSWVNRWHIALGGHRGLAKFVVLQTGNESSVCCRSSLGQPASYVLGCPGVQWPAHQGNCLINRLRVRMQLCFQAPWLRPVKKDLPGSSLQKRAGAKGFGLFSCKDLSAGDFIIEYIGEVLEEEEYLRRWEGGMVVEALTLRGQPQYN